MSEPPPFLSPLSGVYLIGVCSQPWDAQPFGVGSEVDAGLGVLGVSTLGAADAPP